MVPLLLGLTSYIKLINRWWPILKNGFLGCAKTKLFYLSLKIIFFMPYKGPLSTLKSGF